MKIQSSSVAFATIIAAIVTSVCSIAALSPSLTAFAQAQSTITSSAPMNNSATLGSPFLESNGMVTGQRVLEVLPLPKVETSFFENDTFKGDITASETGTYSSVMRNDGSLYGEGQGIITTKDGEMATWTGQGVGHFMADGKLRFHGSLFYDTSSAGKLSFLKNMVGMFDFEVDQTGKTTAKVWEWK